MLQANNILHRYEKVEVLNVPEWQLAEGEHCLILGNSGSGKTTFLYILGGLLQPSEGEIQISNQSLYSLKGAKLDRFRAQNIGMVFQRPHLISSLSVEDNLLLAQYMGGLKTKRERVQQMLARLGIVHRAGAKPQQLSGGEAQRLSVARAVLNNPKIVLADEPTASLDDENAAQVIQLLKHEAETCGASLVIATHDQRIKSHFSNIFQVG